MSAFHIEDLLHENLVFCDMEAVDHKDLLTKMCRVACDNGFIKETYIEAVLEREESCPTGLPTNVLKVAVPHAMDKSHVITSAISVAKLKKPVNFKEMGSSENDVPVDIVFMLAVNGSKDQLTVLQQVVGLFSKEEALQDLKEACTPADIIHCLKKHVV